MRLTVRSLVIVLFFFLISCGGGSGKMSSRSGVEISVGFENARTAETGFYVSNTYVGSVILGYHSSFGDEDSIDITAQAGSEGRVLLSRLMLNASYTFTVTAYDAQGEELCTGSDSIYLSSDDEQDLTLRCEFADDVAAENAVYDFVSLLYGENSGSLTAADLAPYVSEDFGLMNGMTREEFLADLLSDDYSGFSENGITVTNVEMVTPDARESGQEAYFLIYFSDGTVMTERIWVTKADGSWVLTGNGRKYDTNLFAEAYKITKTDGTDELYSGITVDFYNPGNLMESASISGEGLSSSYYLEPSCDDCGGVSITSPSQYYESDLMNGSFMILDGLSYGTEPLYNDPVYTVSSVYEDSSTDSYTEKVYGSPEPVEVLTDDHFVSVNAPASNSVSIFTGSPVTLSYTKPTAFTVRYIEYEILLKDVYGHYDTAEGMLPLNRSSMTADFTDLADDFEPTSGEVHIRAFDEDGKAYTTVIMLDNNGSDADYTFLSAFSLTDLDTSGMDIRSIGGGSFVGCMTGTSMIHGYTNTYFLYGDDENGLTSLYFDPGSGEKFEGCAAAVPVTDENSSYAGSAYAVGAGGNPGSIFISRIASDGSAVWSKVYHDMYTELYVKDAEIIRSDHLLVLATDDAKIYLFEFDADGGLYASKEIWLTNGELAVTVPAALDIGSSGTIAVAGKLQEPMENRYDAFAVITDTSYSSYTAYRAVMEDGMSNPVNSGFTDVSVKSATELYLAGFSGESEAGDLMVSVLNMDTNLFSGWVADNYSTHSEGAERVSLASSSFSEDTFYVAADIGGDYIEIIRFQLSSAQPQPEWQRSLSDTFYRFSVNAADADEYGNLLLTGFYKDKAGQENSELLLGTMDSDGDISDVTPEDFFTSDVTYAGDITAYTDMAAQGDDASSVTLEIYSADAGNSLTPSVLTETELDPEND